MCLHCSTSNPLRQAANPTFADWRSRKADFQIKKGKVSFTDGINTEFYKAGKYELWKALAVKFSRCFTENAIRSNSTTQNDLENYRLICLLSLKSTSCFPVLVLVKGSRTNNWESKLDPKEITAAQIKFVLRTSCSS